MKQEGAGGLLQGAPATALRAMGLNFGMLAFNSKAPRGFWKKALNLSFHNTESLLLIVDPFYGTLSLP